MNKNTIAFLTLLFTTLILMNIDIVFADINDRCTSANSTDYDWRNDSFLKLTEITQMSRKATAYSGRKDYLSGGAENGGKGISFKGSGQGFAVNDDYFLIVKTYDNETYYNKYPNTYPYNTNGIVLIAKNAGILSNSGVSGIVHESIITEVTEGWNFGHANDATWNSKNEQFIIINDSDKANNNYYMEKFTVTNGHINNVGRTKTSRCFGGIAYNADSDGYVARGCLDPNNQNNTHNTIYILDKNFNVLKSWNLQWNHLTPQGLEYSNGYVYLVNWERGSKNIYCFYNSLATNSNLLYQYDLNGNFIKTLHIPSSVVSAEAESAAIDKDRNFYVMYNISAHDIEIDPSHNEGTACTNNVCVGASTQSVFASDYFKQVTSIDIDSSTRKIYSKNESIDSANSFIAVTYIDGYVKKIPFTTTEVTVSGFDTSTTGEKVVTVTYGGETKTYKIQVVDYTELNTNSTTRIAHLKKGQDILSNSNMRYQKGASLNNSDGIRGMTIVKNNNTEYIYFAVLGNSHSNAAMYKMTTTGSGLTKGNNVFFGSTIDLTYNKDIDESNGGVIVSGHEGNECCLADNNNQTLSSQCTTDASQYACGTSTGYELYNGVYNKKGMISYISINNSTPFVKRRTYYPDIIQHTAQTESKTNEAFFNSIAYDKDNQVYYARRNNNYIWMLDTTAKKYSDDITRYNKQNGTSYALENIINLSVKGWAYYKGLLYLAIYGGYNSNIIMAYNLKGHLESIYHFPESSFNTNLEISGIDFDESGNMYLGFNNLTDENYVDFYKIQTPTTSKEDYLNYSNDVSVDTTNNIIKNLKINTTFDTIIDKINTNTNYQMLDKDNNRKDRTATLKTGDKIKYNFNNTNRITQISITGDVTGTGTITEDDVTAAFNYLREKINNDSSEIDLDNPYNIASDTLKDEIIDIRDIAKLNKYVKNKINSLD